MNIDGLREPTRPRPVEGGARVISRDDPDEGLRPIRPTELDDEIEQILGRYIRDSLWCIQARNEICAAIAARGFDVFARPKPTSPELLRDAEAIVELRRASEFLADALEAEQIPDDIGARVMNRFLFGHPDPSAVGGVSWRPAS